MEEGDVVAEVNHGSLKTECSFKIIFRKLVCMIASCQESCSGSRIHNLYFEVGLGPIFRWPGKRQTSKQVLVQQPKAASTSG